MKTEQKSFEEKTAQGLDTVTRYNVAVRNAPGQFAMLHKSELAVDPAYQRNNINPRRVDAITRTWDWVACGCLVVNPENAGLRSRRRASPGGAANPHCLDTQ